MRARSRLDALGHSGGREGLEARAVDGRASGRGVAVGRGAAGLLPGRGRRARAALRGGGRGRGPAERRGGAGGARVGKVELVVEDLEGRRFADLPALATEASWSTRPRGGRGRAPPSSRRRRPSGAPRATSPGPRRGPCLPAPKLARLAAEAARAGVRRQRLHQPDAKVAALLPGCGRVGPAKVRRYGGPRAANARRRPRRQSRPGLRQPLAVGAEGATYAAVDVAPASVAPSGDDDDDAAAAAPDAARPCAAGACVGADARSDSDDDDFGTKATSTSRRGPQSATSSGATRWRRPKPRNPPPARPRRASSRRPATAGSRLGRHPHRCLGRVGAQVIPRPTPVLGGTMPYEQVKMLACSARHTLVVTVSRRVFACGDNEDGARASGVGLVRGGFGRSRGETSSFF